MALPDTAHYREALAHGDSRRLRERTVVLLGHEIQGVPEAQVEAADVCVEIPMVGLGASLNVAVAGSLVLYRLAGMV
jgi:tRNA (guanosine-2'-O-)-methyltransferase